MPSNADLFMINPKRSTISLDHVSYKAPPPSDRGNKTQGSNTIVSIVALKFWKVIVTSTSQGQKFQKFEEYPKSVQIKMADLAGR